MGIEAVLVDNDWMTISSLSSQDDRSLRVRVAGPTALLIAKAHKINDRLQQTAERPDRLSDKDALDAYRLMQTTPMERVSGTIPALLGDSRSEQVSKEGLTLLTTLFGSPRSPGVEMIVRAVAAGVPSARIETLCATFVGELRRLLPPR
jgi:hypothetical protein